MLEKTTIAVRDGIEKSIVTEDERLLFVTHQDIDPVLKQVEMLRDEPVGKDFRAVAVIPDVIVEQMMRDGSWNDPAAIKRWVNDPQNDCFRVWRGKI